jgi:O-antigen/teichoic acid export membrane protein
VTSTRAVARNTLYLTIGLFTGRILAVFIYRKMAPLLGTGGYGVATLAIDVSSILLIIANYGLGTLITREVTRDRTMTLPVMWSALKIRLVLGVGCYLSLILYAWLSGFGTLQRDALFVMGLGVFLEASAMACDGVLQAHDRVISQMWGQIASAIAYFALAWWLLDAGYGVMGVMWANVASRAVRLLVMVPLMLAGTGPWILRPAGRDAVPAAHARGLLHMGWPIFLASTFGILYYKIDTPLLRAFADESAVGIYTLGHRALDYLAMVPGLFATALFPTMLRAAEAQGGMERVSERALRYLHLIVLPVTLLFTLAAAPVTMWLAKGETGFADSIVVFRIVIWGMPFLAASTVLNRMLYTAGKERSFIVIALTTLAFNIGLNIAVIPRWGYFGTSVVVVASQALSTVLHWVYIRRAGMQLPVARSLVNATLALAVAWFGAAGLAQLVAPNWGTTWIALPIAAGWVPALAVIGLTTLLYVPAIWFTRSITRADLPVLRSLVKRSDGGWSGRGLAR